MGYILVLAILILGGTIATIGDRIGTKVGKARLSVFKLRPKNTATLITIATGGMISASTLGILLATSSQLQDGLFRLDSIRNDLNSATVAKEKAQAELIDTKTQKDQQKRDLDRQKRNLDQINKSLSTALFRQSKTQTQLGLVQQKFQSAKIQLAQIQTTEQELVYRNQKLQAQQQTLVIASAKLQTEQQKLTVDLRQSKQEQVGLRQKVKDAQTQFNNLSKQSTDLLSELADLQDLRNRLIISVQNLRLGDVAIRKEQVLALGITKPFLSSRERLEVIDQLLQQAERSSRQLLEFLPDQEPKDAVIKVTEAQIKALAAKLIDGRSYAIRLQSAGNFLKRETSVFVVGDVYPNVQVFKSGQIIVSLSFTPDLNQAQLEERVDRLFRLANLRATQEGVLADPITRSVGTFSPTILDAMLKMIAQIKTKYEIQAIAKQTIFTGSSLDLVLVIIENGIEIARFG